MTDLPASAPAPVSSPPWQGVHHIALVTADLDATVRFYCGVLGMRLLLTRRAPNGDPHLFIDAGGGATLHFWQTDSAEIFRQPLGYRGYVPGAMQHLALRLPDEDALRQLQARLREAGWPRSPGTTPLAYAHHVSALLSTEHKALHALTAAYHIARYGDAPPTPEQVADAQAALDRIVQALDQRGAPGNGG